MTMTNEIKTMTRESCNLLDLEMKQVLKAVAEKHGLTLIPKGGTFTSGSFTAKFEMAVVGDGGIALSREADNFTRMAQFYGLKSNDLGKEFISGGKIYTVCGLKPKSTKYPILGKGKDGKMYKFSEKAVAGRILR